MRRSRPDALLLPRGGADGLPPPAPPLRNPVDAAAALRPEPDGLPDPGEVVWTWVPYEDDPTQGKDRPVLVIGEEGDQLLALQLTSRDHDADAAQEHRDGREWMDIGTGAWDAQRRPSEVRLNRLLRLDRPAYDVRGRSAA